jgi:hypothetical protein
MGLSIKISVLAILPLLRLDLRSLSQIQVRP